MVANATTLSALVSGNVGAVKAALSPFLPQLEESPEAGSTASGLALDVARAYNIKSSSFGVSMEQRCMY